MWGLASLPCALPTTKVPDEIDLQHVGTLVAQTLQRALEEEDLVPDALWRDHFAMTGTIRTFYSARTVAAAWKEVSNIVKPSSFHVNGTPRVVRVTTHSWVDVPVRFMTEGPPGVLCNGIISITPAEVEDKWQIWVIKTVADQLTSQPSVDKLEPVREASHSEGINDCRDSNGTNGINGANGAHNPSTQRFDVVILGGGQAGLATGGRLQALGVSYVVVEKQANVGDSWKTRYDSTKLHTIREFGHLPFEKTFTDPPYPEYLTKDQLAEGYQRWAAKYNINIWLSTTILSGDWSKETETWTLKILRHDKESTITCSFFVFAGGAGSQVPVAPTYENRDIFKGTAVHSSEYKNSKAWAGKHGIVIGSGNTAHDVAEDMLSAGLASVTMVQRNSTFVLPAEYYATSQRPYYNRDTPTEIADILAFTGPFAVGRLIQKAVFEQQAQREPERLNALERAGFKVDRDGELLKCLMERFGGYYMDVGCSKKISDGSIKMKADSLPVRWNEDSLEFDDHSRLKADLVVFATGFVCNMRLVISSLLGSSVAGELDDYWGLDEEGELRGAYKQSGHPAFWYIGGAVAQTRLYSRFIALQIKAKLLGTPFHEYKNTPFPLRYKVPVKTGAAQAKTVG